MKEVICVICPKSCHIHVTKQNDSWDIQGNGCKRGVGFAISEVENPMRSLTTTVRTTFSECPLLPVKTDKDIPLSKIMAAMELINQTKLNHKVALGDVIIENILDTGANVISTSDLF